jgi:hypothetical protein
MDKFTDENGNFKSNYDKDQLGYIIELSEWVFEHNNMSIEEKKEYLLGLEKMIDTRLKVLFTAGNYSFEKFSDKLN